MTRGVDPAGQLGRGATLDDLDQPTPTTRSTALTPNIATTVTTEARWVRLEETDCHIQL